MTAATSPPVLQVDGPLAEALGADALRRIDGPTLTAWLMTRRWFGGKGRAPDAVRIAEVVPVGRGDQRAAVARAEVRAGNRVTSYQLPFAVRSSATGEPPESTLVTVQAANGEGILFDAVEDPVFCRELGAAFRDGAQYSGDAVRWIIEPVGEGHDLAAMHEPRVVSGEQSNTSIIFGERAILKLFRRLEDGINPDVEVARFLTTRTAFRGTPALLGVIRFESDTLHATGGMLQEFVSGSSDAWRSILDRSRSYFDAPANNDARGEGPVTRDAEQLGRTTRELHDALASGGEEDRDPEFAAERAGRGDTLRWEGAARKEIDEGLDLLAARIVAKAIPEERAAEARVLVQRRKAYADLAHELAAVVGDDAGERIRHHGDYHLGQVLRSGDGTFTVIDFEGEPARPLAERRERNSALRDVAGMLRSFAYAAATLAASSRQVVEPQVRETRAARWERDARDAFMRGYLRGPPARFLPSVPERVAALLALFETEKAFYELSYELNNRPEWIWIPMRGISKLLVASRAGR